MTDGHDEAGGEARGEPALLPRVHVVVPRERRGQAEARRRARRARRVQARHQDAHQRVDRDQRAQDDQRVVERDLGARGRVQRAPRAPLQQPVQSVRHGEDDEHQDDAERRGRSRPGWSGTAAATPGRRAPSSPFPARRCVNDVDLVERAERADHRQHQHHLQLVPQAGKRHREELPPGVRPVDARGLVQARRDLQDARQEQDQAEAELAPHAEHADGRQRGVEVAEPARRRDQIARAPRPAASC